MKKLSLEIWKISFPNKPELHTIPNLNVTSRKTENGNLTISRKYITAICKNKSG